MCLGKTVENGVKLSYNEQKIKGGYDEVLFLRLCFEPDQ